MPVELIELEVNGTWRTDFFIYGLIMTDKDLRDTGICPNHKDQEKLVESARDESKNVSQEPTDRPTPWICMHCADLLSVNRNTSETTIVSGRDPCCAICLGLLGRVESIAKQCIQKLTSTDDPFAFQSLWLVPQLSIIFELREYLWRILYSSVRTDPVNLYVVSHFKKCLLGACKAELVKAGIVDRGFIDSEIGYKDDIGIVSIRVEFGHAQAEAEMIELADRVLGPGNSRKHEKRRYNVSKSGHNKPQRPLALTITRARMDAIVHDAVEFGDHWRSLNWSDFVESCSVCIEFKRGPVFLSGNYNKFARGLAQSPWSIDGKLLSSTSVAELVSLPFKAAFSAEDYKFHSAGREDIDVRMLGDGRPFVVELLNAHQIPSTEKVQYVQNHVINNKANPWVTVHNSEVTSKKAMDSLLLGENSKRKQYSCIVWVSKVLNQSDLERLNSLKDIGVEQLTPLRVLHRRSALEREKIIHSCTSEQINDHFFILRLVASAGTYIKEFVHSDLGRTNPSVASILECDAEIIQLDVEEVILH